MIQMLGSRSIKAIWGMNSGVLVDGIGAYEDIILLSETFEWTGICARQFFCLRISEWIRYHNDIKVLSTSDAY
jgi:hypothetical protein